MIISFYNMYKLKLNFCKSNKSMYKNYTYKLINKESFIKKKKIEVVTNTKVIGKFV
jgi:hypothetical protein